MKAALADAGVAASVLPEKLRLPFWLKLAFTAYMAVLLPVYLRNYGPTNFVYFCDASLLLALISTWTGHPLPASMAAIGVVIPQLFWCVEFGVELLGGRVTGLTSYMFDPHRSLLLRGLSLFHGWLPFLLVYMVWRMGYDRRALKYWTIFALLLCCIAFFWLPPAGAVLANPRLPINVNLVFGFDDAHPQTLMPQGLYLAVWFLALFFLAYLPADFLLKKLSRIRTHLNAPSGVRFS